MRFHLPSLPGRSLDKGINSSCAYSMKAAKFARMMRARGHEVITYGDESADVNCYQKTEPLLFEPSFWQGANRRAAIAINEIREEGDLLLLSMGECQRSLAEAVPLRAVEYGVGYGGVFADFRVFESYAWMHIVYGHLQGTHSADGRFYDAVIPNFFEVEDFPFRAEKGDYLLYVGRMTRRKGAGVAAEIARGAGMPLILAGEGEEVPAYGEHVGPVGHGERGQLMAGARAVLCPTLYVEPFGGAAVEAMLCGTPVISTDWGAFTETILQGVTGYRCRRLGEFIWAAEAAASLDPQTICDYAMANYSTEAVAPRYEAYFSHLQTLDGAGWYDSTPLPPAALRDEIGETDA